MATTTKTKTPDVPVGIPSSKEPTFRLISPDGQRIHLNLCETDGRAEIQFSLKNLKPNNVRGTLQLDVESPASAAWFQIVGKQTRDIRKNETAEFRVQIAIPPDTPVPETQKQTKFRFAVIGFNETNKEGDDTGEGELRPAVEIDWKPVPAIKRMSRGKLAATILSIVAVLGIVGGGLYWWITRSTPEKTLANVNASASAGDWESYWDCWTTQGQHKLVYWLCHDMRAYAANNLRWRDELKAWLGSFGLTLNDLKKFDKAPRLLRAYEATDKTRDLRRKMQEHGRSEQSLFATAAKWNEYTDDDWKEYKKRRKSGLSQLSADELKSDGSAFEDHEEDAFRDSILQNFRFQLLCKVPMNDKIEKQIRNFQAVSVRDMKESDRGKQHSCLDCDVVSRARKDPKVSAEVLKAAKDLVRSYGHLALDLSLQQVDGVWLIDDFFNDGAKAGDTFETLPSSESTIQRVTIDQNSLGGPSATIKLDSAVLTGTLQTIEDSDAPNKLWKQNFLFMDHVGETALAKTEDQYRFQTRGDVFLKVILPAAENDAVWLSRPDGFASVSVFLELTGAEAATLCPHLGVKPIFLSNGTNVTLDAVKDGRVRTVYKETGNEISQGTDEKITSVAAVVTSRKSVEILSANDSMPRDQTVYFECGEPDIPSSTRIVDGDGDAVAKADIGAFELQATVRGQRLPMISPEARPLNGLMRFHLPKLIAPPLPPAPASGNEDIKTTTPTEDVGLAQAAIRAALADFDRRVDLVKDREIVVDSVFDEIDGNLTQGELSLREAVFISNNLPPEKQACQITFDDSIIASGAPISLSLGTIDITQSVRISAPPEHRVTISGMRESRVFTIESEPGVNIDVALHGLRITDGHSSESDGGAILSIANLTVDRCIIDNNFTGKNGGGICSTGGELKLFQSWFINNQAAVGGGIFANDRIWASQTVFAENESHTAGGLYVAPDSAASLVECTVLNNRLIRPVFGISYPTGPEKLGDRTVFVSKPEFMRGGGILNLGKTTLSNSTVHGNLSFSGGGGIMNYGSMSIDNCSISLNRSRDEGTGGIECGAVGTVEILRSTVSGNRGESVGGISIDQYCSLKASYCTIADNIARETGGLRLLTDESERLELNAIIIAGNLGNVSADLEGKLPLPASCCLVEKVGSAELNGVGNITEVDPMLGPLQNNGGMTSTHALLPGSPAIDAVVDSAEEHSQTKFDHRAATSSDTIKPLTENNSNLGDNEI